jgi:WhiB family redox-sensing transcriptional regulator
MSVWVTWRAVAACRDADPDLFFPIGTGGPARREIDEAKRICRTCPAQAQCLAWALDHGVTDGVWGGTTADDRRALRSLPGRIALTRRMTMATPAAGQNTENIQYVRGLLRDKDHGFAAALELAADLVCRELSSAGADASRQEPATRRARQA